MILGALSAQANVVKSALKLHLSATVISAVSLIIVGVLVMLALGFAGTALFLALAEDMSPVAAALSVAAGALILALVVWLTGSLIGRTRRRAAQVALKGAVAPFTAMGLAAAPPPPSPATGRKATPPPAPPTTHAMMLDHGMAVGARAHAAVAAHPVRLLAAGLGLGVAVGLSPGLRRGLRRLLPW
ncbi:MAG: hypothetical protein WCZ23_00135 [Rhodospirillaceae bacterium]